ncbi:uncharacterized protein LOC110887936 [Helianthus annuus]|uniref:uncharacterized protein LOC110887936 n=1 Tax=Helianthus annuus TaxID=4232 RepID=UPI001652E95C|nr:uncharacterized protein LOC110887936 [Helianthus annuus]
MRQGTGLLKKKIYVWWAHLMESDCGGDGGGKEGPFNSLVNEAIIDDAGSKKINRQNLQSRAHGSKSLTSLPGYLGERLFGQFTITPGRGIRYRQNLQSRAHGSKSLTSLPEVAFWLDVWAAPEPFQVLFPSLFQLEVDKGSLVADKFRPGSIGSPWVWRWKRGWLNTDELTEFQQLNNLLQHITVTSGPDSWLWSLDSTGQFKVSSLRRKLVELNYVKPDYVVDWNNWVPKKVGLVAWRAEKERLPTRTALHRRGISIQNLECLMCREYDESCDHLFVSCGFAQVVWQVVCQWCKTQQLIAFRLQDILDAYKRFGGSTEKKKAFHAVCLVSLWSIWNLRNELMFTGKSKTISAVVEEIKLKSFGWVKHRSKEATMTWEKWQSFDVF